MNECSRKKKAKVSEPMSHGVFLARYRRIYVQKHSMYCKYMNNTISPFPFLYQFQFIKTNFKFVCVCGGGG